MLKLRLRAPTGSSTLQLHPQATRSELYDLISTQTEIPISKLEVRIGFPRPQLLPSSAPDATIESLGLRHGDTVQASASISTTTDTTPPITPQPQTRTAPPQAPSKPTAPQQTGPPLTPSSSRQVSASVSLESGHLTLRLVPDDNSCLFRAVGLCLEQHQSSPNVSAKLRHIVADRVREDPVNWCEPVLGRSPELYVKKIMEVDVWGGAIELAILAQHYQTEICSIDVQTGRVDRFGESENYSNRIFVVYSGIHYDALTLAPSADSTDLAFDTTIFDTKDDTILYAALQLVSQLRDQHYYTDTASFTLRCTICNTALVGETDARRHAEETGHTQFGEYA